MKKAVFETLTDLRSRNYPSNVKFKEGYIVEGRNNFWVDLSYNHHLSISMHRIFPYSPLTFETAILKEGEIYTNTLYGYPNQIRVQGSIEEVYDEIVRMGFFISSAYSHVNKDHYTRDHMLEKIEMGNAMKGLFGITQTNVYKRLFKN